LTSRLRRLNCGKLLMNGSGLLIESLIRFH
jgi:hypothetical protein